MVVLAWGQTVGEATICIGNVPTVATEDAAIVIVEAVPTFVETGVNVTVVFCGGDGALKDTPCEPPPAVAATCTLAELPFCTSTPVL